MRLWPHIGSTTIMLAALVGGAWAQGGPKSQPSDAWKPADRKVIVYTKDRPPATPGLEDLQLKASVSQWGVTWTFDKPARIGQFVNGDFYVVGPVAVVKINPAPRMARMSPKMNSTAARRSRLKIAAATARCSDGRLCGGKSLGTPEC